MSGEHPVIKLKITSTDECRELLDDTIWRAIPGFYNEYYCARDGRVRNVHGYTLKLINQRLRLKGRQGHYHCHSIAWLVYKTWKNPRLAKAKGTWVRYIDGNSKNCHIDNLKPIPRRKRN
ncbi:MAG TPA: hypothetical protein VJ327_11335 [Patescibacteria group bacterium]|nr:hypothetical protein [Patescibacteria group bacterium]